MRGSTTHVMIAAATAYVVLRLVSAVSTDLATSPLRYYGVDVLAPLVLIPLFAWMQVLWGLRSPYQPLGALEIILYVTGFSLIYEILLPVLSPRSVGDVFDVAAYAVGGAVLWLVSRGTRKQLSRRTATVVGAELPETVPGR